MLRRAFARVDPEDDGARRDPPFVGHSSRKDIEDAPPERAAELAGHPTERVET